MSYKWTSNLKIMVDSDSLKIRKKRQRQNKNTDNNKQ